VPTQLDIATPYQRALTRFVDARGSVAYTQLRADANDLRMFTRSIGVLPEATYRSWPTKDRLAFWLNAYNALTLQLILDQGRGKSSIQEIDKAWDRPRFTVMGKPRTLNQIEHDVVRKQWSEPRIHMALVCAARGCPILRREAYDGANLSAQLAAASRAYLASPAGLVVDGARLRVSKIFDWYGDDWIRDGKSKARAVVDFVRRYGPKTVPASGELGLEFLDYDWRLNGR